MDLLANVRLDRRVILGVIVGFAVLAAAVYGPVVTYGFVRWDDALLITDNPAVRTISGWSLAWIFTHFDPELYIPLTFLSYQFDWLIGGGAAWPFHFGNLALHTLNALLAGWTALLLLLRRRDAALLVGLLFLLHPLHAEAVGWASGRKDVLATFFYFSAFIAYLRHRDHGDGGIPWLSVALFGIALLAKVMAVTLPAVLLLVDWRDGRLWRKEQLTEKAPYIALALVFTVVAFVGKEKLVSATTPLQVMLMAGKSTIFYLRQMLWPNKLSLLYPYTGDIAITNMELVLSCLGVVLLASVALLALRRSRLPLFGFALYIVTLAPTYMNFSKGKELETYFASDRYAYVPSFAVFLLVAAGVAMLIDAWPRWRTVIAGVCAAMLGVLGVAAAVQLRTWSSTEALFTNVIAKYPAVSHVAHNNLGNAYRLRGDLAAAEREFRESVALKPFAKPWSNLGGVLRQQHRYDEALGAYQQALALEPDSPHAHFGNGIVLAELGRFAEAEAEYKEAMRLDPTYEEVPTNLGALYAKQGRWDDAVAAYRTALAQNPFYPEAWYNMGVALDTQGKKQDAAAAYQHVVELAPTYIPARINYGILLAELGDRDGSVRQFRAVLALNPNNAAARQALQQLGAL